MKKRPASSAIIDARHGHACAGMPISGDHPTVRTVMAASAVVVLAVLGVGCAAGWRTYDLTSPVVGADDDRPIVQLHYPLNWNADRRTTADGRQVVFTPTGGGNNTRVSVLLTSARPANWTYGDPITPDYVIANKPMIGSDDLVRGRWFVTQFPRGFVVEMQAPLEQAERAEAVARRIVGDLTSKEEQQRDQAESQR